MRTNIVDDHSKIESIINKCPICYVGMVDQEGMPYVLPMNFGFENDIIFLHSAQEGRSISILNNNPNVCITFCTEAKLVWQNEEVACSYRMHSDSVICNGQVVFEDDFDEKVDALDIIMRHYSDREFKYSTPAVKNVKVWKVKIDKVLAKEFGAPVDKQMPL